MTPLVVLAMTEREGLVMNTFLKVSTETLAMVEQLAEGGFPEGVLISSGVRTLPVKAQAKVIILLLMKQAMM